MTRRLVAWRARAVVTALGLVATGCLVDPGGPDYARLSLTATDAGSGATFADCFTLPVLPGSRVDDEWRIADGVEAYLSGTREAVTVRFVAAGGLLTEPLSFTEDDLDEDFERQIVLEVPGGGEVRVELSSTCPGEETNGIAFDP
jgi:hypothetical protein